ncbi:hypothetical protein GCM10010331_77340 [Streptomyces xanthochromogenes]|uniref:hypothetical protein n=1 Tax=Streptomyces TaxID=1883 RepID=UPI00141DC917|nr:MULTISPECIES: hypothetical protein [Streptomyces]GHB78193.1 hypothetical protein GCM10010331_77340 [Streptomyces xanthochromogenes]
MASKSELVKSLRAVRQLRHVRGFYALGLALWTASTAWTAWQSPGSPQMWVSVLLLVIFSGLLGLTSLWLQRLRARERSDVAHHAAPRTSRAPGHAHA